MENLLKVGVEGVKEAGGNEGEGGVEGEAVGGTKSWYGGPHEGRLEGVEGVDGVDGVEGVKGDAGYIFYQDFDIYFPTHYF